MSSFSENVLQLDELCAGYRGHVLLENVNLTVKEGEVVSVIGPNGAGKSTLLKTVIGQLKKLGGTIFVCGRDADDYTPEKMARLRSVLLTEKVKGSHLTVFDLAASGRYPHTGRMGRLTDHDREVIRHSLAQVHAEELEDRPFAELSDGQKQRVLLARALCQEPRLLVLDEPYAFLDIRYQLEVMNLIQRLAREEGLTVLMSIHEINLAMKYSDLVILISDDHTVRAARPQDITKADLGELFGIPEDSYDLFF